MYQKPVNHTPKCKGTCWQFVTFQQFLWVVSACHSTYYLSLCLVYIHIVDEFKNSHIFLPCNHKRKRKKAGVNKLRGLVFRGWCGSVALGGLLLSLQIFTHMYYLNTDKGSCFIFVLKGKNSIFSCEILSKVKISYADIFMHTVRSHRGVWKSLQGSCESC